MRNKCNLYVLNLKTLVRAAFLLTASLLGFIFATQAADFASGFANAQIGKAAFAAAIPTVMEKGGLPRLTVSRGSIFTLAMPALRTGQGKTAGEETREVIVSDEPPQTAAQTEVLSPPAQEATYKVTAQKGYVSTEGIYINNQTDYQIDLPALLGAPLPFSKEPGKPLVLIVHTHTSESYTPTEQYNYTPSDTDRTEDINFTVARVGGVIFDKLTAEGISAIHDTSINDYPSYSGSYNKTLGIIESYIREYPSIKVVLDIHRDYIEKSDGTKMKAVCNYENAKAAQVMLVVGTSGSGLTHPDWKNNLSFGLKLQKELVDSTPNLARPLNLRNSRFNGHTAPAAIIVEVGTSGNTLEEAMLGAELFSGALIDVLDGI